MALTKKDFETLSEFRYQLRRFLRFSEHAVRVESVTPLQYLAVQSFPTVLPVVGRDPRSLGIHAVGSPRRGPAGSQTQDQRNVRNVHRRATS